MNENVLSQTYFLVHFSFAVFCSCFESSSAKVSISLSSKSYQAGNMHCSLLFVRRAKFSFIERLNSSLFQFQSNLLKSAQILNGRERNSTVPSKTLHKSLIKCTSYCEFGLPVLVVPFLLRGGQRQTMPPCR